MAAGIEARDFAVEFFLHSEGRRMSCSNGIHKPETGIVARVLILGAGITQPHDQINTC